MNEWSQKITIAYTIAVLLIWVPAFGAEVSGTVTIPSSDMNWTPSAGGMQVRVEGTNIQTDVHLINYTQADFRLTNVPNGLLTLLLIEGNTGGYPNDVFTESSKRLDVVVSGDTLSGVSFDLVYHWQELAGYPAIWGSTGYGEWNSHFITDQVGFLLYRVRGAGIDPERSEIYRTLDGGKTWNEIGHWEYNDLVEPYPAYWRSFYFSDQNHGIILAAVSCIPCGWCGAGFLYTADGGVNWSYVSLPLPSDAYSINIQRYAQINQNQIIAAGSIGCGVQGYSLKFYSAIWESNDAGATWILKWLSEPNEEGPFTGLGANVAGKAIAFITGYAGGPRRYVLREVAGTWSASDDSSIVTNSGYGPADIPMVGDRAWVQNSTQAALPYGLYRSENAGSDWSKIADVLMQYMAFGTTDKGFALAGGPAYVSYDGGESWYYQSGGGGACCHLNNIWAFDSIHAVWQEGGAGDPNNSAQIFSYNEPWVANFEVLQGLDLVDADIYGNDKKLAVGSFKLFNHGPVPLVLDHLGLRAFGSGNEPVDVTALKLWWDKNADGKANAGDALLSSGSFNTDDGSAQLAGGGLVLRQFLPVYILITYDFNEYLFRGKTYAFTLAAADMSAKTRDTQQEQYPSAPLNYSLYSRELTVAPDDMSAVKAFVTRFYQLCLNRNPDPKGLQNWVNSLLNGSLTGSDVAYGFVFSPEFLEQNTTNDAFLEILYRAFFNRSPDPGGWDVWMAELEKGTDRAHVLNGFIYAKEFNELCRSFEIMPNPVGAFVTRFYQLCLKRNPDIPGLEGWVSSLLSGNNVGADVAEGFIFSPEFTNTDISHAEYLDILYKAFFNRDPDPAGFQTWLAELNSGTDRSDVLSGFIYSVEFGELCKKFGITPF